MKALTWLFLLLAIPLAIWALDQVFYLIPGPVLGFVWIAGAITWLVVAVIAVVAWLINRAVEGG